MTLGESPRPFRAGAHSQHSTSHQLLGALWRHSLTQVRILVHVEPKLLGDSPRADVLLLRRAGEAWDETQRARLPDGVRDSAAGHVLVEFKYSESVNDAALAQTVAYDHFYRQGQMLSEQEVMTVLLSARSPLEDRLAGWGYEEVKKGVYRSGLPLLRRVCLLALNELEAEPHNAYVKIFASRAQEREAAFAALETLAVEEEATLQSYVLGLRVTMEDQGESAMAQEWSPDQILEIGEKVREFVLETTSPEAVGEALRRRILETASPAERLAGLDAQERLAGLDAQERLAGLDAQERLAGLDAQERLAGMTAAERGALLQLLQDEVDPAAACDSERNGD